MCFLCVHTALRLMISLKPPVVEKIGEVHSLECQGFTICHSCQHQHHQRNGLHRHHHSCKAMRKTALSISVSKAPSGIWVQTGYFTLAFVLEAQPQLQQANPILNPSVAQKCCLQEAPAVAQVLT